MGDQQVQHEYGAGDITVLEGLEAVRKRPGMYIGSTGERGLHHLVYEVVDNSVDEALAGYCDHIEVAIQADGGLRVSDNGRGIPVDMHPTEKRPTVEVVMTILHAGGKFGSGGYAVSGGLHGVGVSVVNALSVRMDTVVKRQGYVWRQSFGNGGHPLTELERGEETEETGTQQTFYPDPEIFETTTFSFEILRQRFQQMAFLNKGLRITLTDERPEATDAGDLVTGDAQGTADDPVPGFRQVSFMYENGLRDYVEFINHSKKSEVINPEIIDFESVNEDASISLEIALQWTTAYSESVHTYANTINTTEGGTHEEGFRSALTSLMNKYARDKGILKDKDHNLTGDDIREGLTAVISVKLTEPQFEGQTKTKLGNTEARTFVQQQVYSKLGDWLDAHPMDAKAILVKAQQAATARVAARKAREATRRKSALESVSMPGKLRDCSSRDASQCEIYIVEGDSAGGSAVQGRDPAHQAILPIRGKILNVEKARLDRALSSQEIQSLITAFGTGIGEDFDISKLRYNAIVIMADADVDGQHIATLLLTLLFRYMRPLIEKGHVFIACPPLYRLKWSNAPHQFVFSDRQRDEYLEDGKTDGKRLPKEGGVQRYKGLGEMNPQELWETTMNPEDRMLKQVTLSEAASADEVFSMLMGEDVESRRAFIQRNATDVRFLDI
ncbi:MAG: DNA topoisomerase (ATP-hydrolyzing) subunit B [Varibaculum cambriense]|uniref:DNA gyrase subunit B n=1 Tax=Varibaculum cambriense TaxID=184870 RepID=A0ABX4UST5_9ACTO|nr:DNA topoisomerase (ATP-hydrolyzing) subunit B [Varibaculum cambriense]MDK8274966.1 DNA topoisomerase (ATP-hydrolyzing) subunit B [Varibaculum cambriense]MDU5268207.1 DNA topoisomerase (ATP-hydrolyzing) subunit B [Varibaculum cambriense]MDU5614086.1 DNA topoisomerase (ATP-hydrolyzing) subunit B [Varibaculum cambriense]MDU6680902.1 DNA topoisomerase (ATP-hydrolyzing) subunit B [Varibaculum cambriense]MDU7407183.1 DNA topoisomerase (ATP-hydrolyzing) subunit B [Varibaculum cambriense]